jgi:hypothetical protein
MKKAKKASKPSRGSKVDPTRAASAYVHDEDYEDHHYRRYALKAEQAAHGMHELSMHDLSSPASSLVRSENDFVLSPKKSENIEMQDTVYISMVGGGENFFGDDPSQGQLSLLNPSGMVIDASSTGPVQGGGNPRQNPMHVWTPQSVPAFPNFEGCVENAQRRSEFLRAFLQRTAQKFFELENVSANQQETINALCKTMQDAGPQITTAIHNLYENLAGVAAETASVAQNTSAMRQFAQYVQSQFRGIAEEFAAIEQLTTENHHRIANLEAVQTDHHARRQSIHEAWEKRMNDLEREAAVQKAECLNFQQQMTSFAQSSAVSPAADQQLAAAAQQAAVAAQQATAAAQQATAEAESRAAQAEQKIANLQRLCENMQTQIDAQDRNFGQEIQRFATEMMETKTQFVAMQQKILQLSQQTTAVSSPVDWAEKMELIQHQLGEYHNLCSPLVSLPTEILQEKQIRAEIQAQIAQLQKNSFRAGGEIEELNGKIFEVFQRLQSPPPAAGLSTSGQGTTTNGQGTRMSNQEATTHHPSGMPGCDKNMPFSGNNRGDGPPLSPASRGGGCIRKQHKRFRISAGHNESFIPRATKRVQTSG